MTEKQVNPKVMDSVNTKIKRPRLALCVTLTDMKLADVLYVLTTLAQKSPDLKCNVSDKYKQITRIV